MPNSGILREFGIFHEIVRNYRAGKFWLDRRSHIAGLLPLVLLTFFPDSSRCVAPQLLFGYNEQVGKCILRRTLARL